MQVKASSTLAAADREHGLSIKFSNDTALNRRCKEMLSVNINWHFGFVFNLCMYNNETDVLLYNFFK